MGTKTKYLFLFITPSRVESGYLGKGIAEIQGEEAGPGRWLGGGFCSRTMCVLPKNTPYTSGRFKSAIFYDNYVLQVYRRPVFDVTHETMTPFHTCHPRVLKRMTHFSSEEAIN